MDFKQELNICRTFTTMRKTDSMPLILFSLVVSMIIIHVFVGCYQKPKDYILYDRENIILP